MINITAFLWVQAGKFIKFDPIGRFNNPGNTYNEIVFIGTNIDKKALNNLLREVLSA